MNIDLVKRKDYQKEDFYKNRKIIYGGFKGEMNWDYYLTGFEASLHPTLEAIKECVIIFGEDLFTDFKNPRFSEIYFFLIDNASAVSFTFRSWGDFMAAINGGGTYKEFYELETSP